jgi:hypothetical protein
MNIFYLDHCPQRAAQAHVDRHVVKMILETAQLLSTAHHLSLSPPVELLEKIYKPTHKNHPSSVWVRNSLANYWWAHELLVALLKEYTFRYSKTHASARLVLPLAPAPRLDGAVFTPPPLAMPDEYKIGAPLESYREYYRKGKSSLHKWTRRAPPTWL